MYATERVYQNVQELTSIQLYLKDYYTDSDFSAIDSEFDSMLRTKLNKIGLKVLWGREALSLQDTEVSIIQSATTSS